MRIQGLSAASSDDSNERDDDIEEKGEGASEVASEGY